MVVVFDLGFDGGWKWSGGDGSGGVEDGPLPNKGDGWVVRGSEGRW